MFTDRSVKLQVAKNPKWVCQP